MDEAIRECRESGVEVELHYADRPVKVIAYFMDERGKWAMGLTMVEALGALMISYPEMFGVRRIRWATS